MLCKDWVPVVGCCLCFPSHAVKNQIQVVVLVHLLPTSTALPSPKSLFVHSGSIAVAPCALHLLFFDRTEFPNFIVPSRSWQVEPRSLHLPPSTSSSGLTFLHQTKGCCRLNLVPCTSTEYLNLTFFDRTRLQQVNLVPCTSKTRLRDGEHKFPSQHGHSTSSSTSMHP